MPAMWYLGGGQQADKVQSCCVLGSTVMGFLCDPGVSIDVQLPLLPFSLLRLMGHPTTVYYSRSVHLIVHTLALWNPKTFVPAALGFSVFAHMSLMAH